VSCREGERVVVKFSEVSCDQVELIRIIDDVMGIVYSSVERC
jgi:hypothetical protein